MRRCFALALALLAVLFLGPWLAAGEAPAPEVPPPPEPQGETAPSLDSEKILRFKRGDRVETISLEDYLRGVLRAEMPASFHQEALKAQAVAARTYTLYKMAHGPAANHPEADVCDDIGCCQAFKDLETAQGEWGMASVLYEEKIRSAVADTDGLAVLYEGEPVLAVFHSSAPGATRPAQEVWAAQVPYLQSVPSPEGEESVPGYLGRAAFGPEAFKETFLARWPEADLGGRPETWFTNIRQQPTGTVTSLQVGGLTLTGDQLRALLGLRSAAFTISFEPEGIVFSTVGYGHGVGMSQYGANVMAQEGKSFRDILTWYYTGTQVGPVDK